MTDNAAERVYVVKAASAWGLFGTGGVLHRLGFETWGDLAAFLAAVYSFLLICEWVYKKVKQWRSK